jgi:excisionase family DNA binding protein
VATGGRRPDTDEVLERLKVTPRTFYLLIKSGDLPAVRIGRQWRFRPAGLDDWLDRNRAALAARLDHAPPPPGSHAWRVADVTTCPLPHLRKVFRNWSGRYMKKAVWSGVVVAAGFLMASSSAFAQTTGTVTVTANVAARAKLQLNNSNAAVQSHSISFNDADPDTTANLTSAPFNVDVKARVPGGGVVNLTVAAGGDLTSGSDTIAINNLSWAGTGAMAGGTANTAAQTVGNWTGSGHRQGTQTYALVNSWAYATGNYTATLTYTLTTP